MEYRNELKFLVRDVDLELIRERIRYIAHRDVHQGNPDGYLITSLYFENVFDKCFREKEDGSDYRHKYRIRIYDRTHDVIKLERKSKVHNMAAKKSVSITENECRYMMQGKLPAIESMFSEEKKRILCEMKQSAMRPKCIVEYRREAFVNQVGNVRITFDKDISASSDIAGFLSPDFIAAPILPARTHILEIKYDNLLPKYIYEALDIDSLFQTSFSKYAYARLKLDGGEY